MTTIRIVKDFSHNDVYVGEEKVGEAGDCSTNKDVVTLLENLAKALHLDVRVLTCLEGGQLD